MTKDKTSITTKDVALMGAMLAIIEVAKLLLSGIAGIEIVSLLFIIYTLFFKKKMIYFIPVFCLLEGVLYGFGIWWFAYLYIWSILAFITYIFRNKKSIWFWSTISGMYGFLFGLLYCPIYVATGGIYAAVSWWLAGISIDIIHGVSNFIICMFLFNPLNRILNYLKKKVKY